MSTDNYLPTNFGCKNSPDRHLLKASTRVSGESVMLVQMDRSYLVGQVQAEGRVAMSRRRVGVEVVVPPGLADGGQQLLLSSSVIECHRVHSRQIERA